MKDYLFICQKWFDKGKGDGQLVRELYPTERGDGSNRNDQKKGFFAGTRPRTSYEEEGLNKNNFIIFQTDITTIGGQKALLLNTRSAVKLNVTPITFLN